MKTALFYPEHSRTSCSDTEITNATAEGSTGCARCTALRLDHRDHMQAQLEAIVQRMRARLVLRSLISNSEWTALADQLAALTTYTPPILEDDPQ